MRFFGEFFKLDLGTWEKASPKISNNEITSTNESLKPLDNPWHSCM